MHVCLRSPLLSLVHAFHILLAATGQLAFLESPSQVVYYPPLGHPGKTVVCRTNQATGITWVSSLHGSLDVATFNITKVSDRKSVMYLTAEFIQLNPVVGGTLTSGSLHCLANRVKSRQFRIREGSLPVILVNPTNVSVNEKDTVQLSCGYEDNRPSPTVFQWRFVNKSGTVKILDRTSVPRDRYSGLTITSVDRSSAGSYACVVANEFGRSLSSPGIVTVKYFGDVTLTLNPGTVVTQGTSVTVNCIVDSVPPADDIRLTYNSQPIIQSNDNLNNHLRYTFVASNDWKGSLTCTASNSIGKDHKTIRLVVQVPPSAPRVNLAETKPFTDSVKFSWILGVDGSSTITSVKITCWDAVRRVTHSRSLNSVAAVSGMLTGLIPGSLYRCFLVARNKVGESPNSHVFNVTTLAAAPARPVLDAQPISVNETSMTIHWTVDYNGGHAITQYTIKWRSTASTASLMETVVPVPSSNKLVNQQQGTWVLTGLSKGTDYFIRIDAKNRVGSNASDAVKYATPCYPGALSYPRIERIPMSSSMSIRFVMDVPTDNDCGVITDYFVIDWATRMQLRSVYVVENGIVTMTITDLDEGREYDVELYTRNQWGEERQGARVSFQVDEYPNSTTGIASDGSNDGLGSGKTVAIIVMCAVVLPAILLACILCIYKRHRSSKDDSDDYTLDFVPGIFKRTTTPQYGYDESDTKPHPGPNSGSTYVNIPESKRRVRKPSLTLVTLPREREVRSGGLPPQKPNVSSCDFSEKGMEQLLQESYISMKVRTSDIIPKLAFMKQIERASPDGSHNPAIVTCPSSKSAGDDNDDENNDYHNDDATIQSSPGSSRYAPCASELDDTSHGHEPKTFAFTNIVTSSDDHQEHDDVDTQTVKPIKHTKDSQHDDVDDTYMEMKLSASNDHQIEMTKQSEVENSEHEHQDGKNLSTLV